MQKTVIIAGAGPGSAGWMPKETENWIGRADCIIGSKRLIAPYLKNQEKETKEAAAPKEIAAYIRQTKSQVIVVLMSGDTGFYSGTKKLRKELESMQTDGAGGCQIQVLPGISSIVYLAAKAGISWEQAALVSVHGKQQNIVPAVILHEDTFILTQSNTADICRRLTDSGLGQCDVWVGENLSYAQERILQAKAQELTTLETDALAVLAVHNPGRKRVRRFGLPDDCFVRGNVPMTKSEVRALVISRMAVRPDDCVYDIGAGTGSVSVELALQAEYGTVYAVELQAEGCRLIQENAENFGLDNIQIIQGNAKDVIEDLPVPDAAFIGGSRGGLDAVLKLLTNKNPRIHVVITAVTLETLHEAESLLKKYGFPQTEILQAGVTRVEEKGRYHMLQAQNPVFIITGGWEDGQQKWRQ